MSFISAPPAAAFDPHSPGALGDVTPGTVNTTKLYEGDAGKPEASIAIGSTNSGRIGLAIKNDDGNVTIFGNGSESKNYIRGATIVQLGALTGKLTTVDVATTGLVAGALAALTNTSLILYADGVAYDIPAKAH